MKQLTCEMCGSTDLMKQDGVFVCQICGCKYSVEEAKKMMIEGTVEVTGTVKVDDSDRVENYYKMALNAYKAGNNKEAENYCNQIIEIDTKHHKAWLLKGVVAGWQSTLQNIRLDEAVLAFSESIKNAPEDQREDVIETSKNEVKKLALAMISLRGDRFAKYPDQEEATGLISDLNTIIKSTLLFMNNTFETIPADELLEPIATVINQSVVKAWNGVIKHDYNGNPNDPDDRPNDHDFSLYLDRIGYCTMLVERAITLCDTDEQSDITRYQNLIAFHESAIAACSWDYSFSNGYKRWYKNRELTDGAKEQRRKLISQYQRKIEEIKDNQKIKEQQERINKYWENHKEEYDKLTEEKARIIKRITDLEEQIAVLDKENMPKLNALISKYDSEGKTPNQIELEKQKQLVTDLEWQHGRLGFFKGKEKKALAERIDKEIQQREKLLALVNLERREKATMYETERAEIEKDVRPLKQELEELEYRKEEIQNELTKER